MDPWTPQKNGNNSTSGNISPHDDEVVSGDTVPNNTLDLHSDQYLWSIEAKLKRMKGSSSREPKARDLIEGLVGVHQAQLQLSCSSLISDLPYISDSEYLEDFERSKFMDQLQKRIAPESQAVNPVELQILVDHDELAKTAVTLGTE